jgi:O-methyltransferase involved in polyketide biosynthesis/acetyl esterase/lipase
MSSQNYIAMEAEKIGHIMLDDRRVKASDIQKSALKAQKRQDYNPPAFISEKMEVNPVFDKQGLYFYVTQKNKETTDYFFYIHGGGFISQITQNEWRFVYDTIERTGYGAVVPIYPLAPAHSVKEALDMLVQSYDSMCKRSDVKRIVLLGYFTGCCLALSLAIQVWKSGFRRPDKVVLASPVLDTEFSDRQLESSLLDRKRFTRRYFYTPEIRNFLRTGWVKESVGHTDITSPIYSDLTDICDEMAIFTIGDDLLNGYARRLYDNVKKLNMKIHYYQFYSIVHDYIEHPHIPECRMVMRKIAESVTEETTFVPLDIQNSVWSRAMMAERYPKLFSDNDAIKLADKVGIEHKNKNSQYTFYDRAVIMERLVAIDDRVKNFIKRYADGIVVNVGCELDTMFDRVDNGRIKWYNVDLPERIEVRRRYMESKDREVNIDKSIFDYSWLDQVSKPQDTAILFVVEDMMKYFDKDRLKSFLDAIWKKFPGAEVVFDVKNSTGKKRWNRNLLMGKSKGTPLRVSVDNCTSLMYDWNIKYKILYDEALLRMDDLKNMFPDKEAWKFKYAIKKKYDKVIHLRLGTEHFIDNE